MRALKPTVFAVSLGPLAKIGVDGARGALTANPIAEVLNRLGFWALFFLIASLFPTPLKTILGWTAPNQVRRMIGLFALFYATLHFGVYVGVDQAFAFDDIGKDLVKRPFITIGFLTLLVLVPLGVTSTDKWVKRLGYSKWKRLHRLAYVAAVTGVIHFVWRVKADLTVPLTFAAVLAVVLGARVVAVFR